MSTYEVRQLPHKLSRFEVLRDGVFIAVIEDTEDETTLTADALTLEVLPPGFRVWHDRFPHLRACLDHLGVADFVPAREPATPSRED